MGQILRDKYEERDLLKALAKLNGLISTQDEKLSDKLHELKLSHNRKVHYLKVILAGCHDKCNWTSDKVEFTRRSIIEFCERALYSDGKVKGVF